MNAVAAESRTAAAHSPVTPGSPPVLPHVRRAVREVLERTPVFAQASPQTRRELATNMVRVSMAAARLLAADAELTAGLAERRAPAAPMAAGLAAGDQLGMQATRAAAGVLAATRKAIDFPNFVTDLISSVFRAMTTSNMQQLEAYADLLKNVSASSEDFADTNVGDDAAISWVLGRFSLFSASTGGDNSSELSLREGVELGEHASKLQSGLDATADEVAAIDAGDLKRTLLPLARRKMGRDRQQVLATLVMMGLQRVVVDKGQLHASMDLRVDTRSASTPDVQDRTDFRLNTGASGSFGVGAWGASANMSMSVGHVHSDQQYTEEEIALRAGLRSSVDLVFRTEQVPLDRLADQQARDKIAGTTFQPAAWSNDSLLPKDRAVSTARIDAAPQPADAPKAPEPKPKAEPKPKPEPKTEPKADPKAKTPPPKPKDGASGTKTPGADGKGATDQPVKQPADKPANLSAEP